MTARTKDKREPKTGDTEFDQVGKTPDETTKGAVEAVERCRLQPMAPGTGCETVNEDVIDRGVANPGGDVVVVDCIGVWRRRVGNGIRIHRNDRAMLVRCDEPIAHKVLAG